MSYYIPTVKELLEGGDVSGHRVAAQPKGRRSVAAPSPTRAGGLLATALDRDSAAEPSGEDVGDLFVLSLRDIRRIVNLVAGTVPRTEPIALSLRDAARLVGVSAPTLRREIAAGQIGRATV